MVFYTQHRTMKSKFLIAVYCGIISSIIKDIISLITLAINKINFWDYAGVVIFGAIPHGLAEHSLAIIVEMGFGIAISLIVIYMAARFDYQNHLVTYPLITVVAWFTVRAGIISFHIKELIHQDLIGAIISILSSD